MRGRRRTRQNSATRPLPRTKTIDATARAFDAYVDVARTSVGPRRCRRGRGRARRVCAFIKSLWPGRRGGRGPRRRPRRRFKDVAAARGARSTLESTNALETTTAAVRKAKADVEARCLEATVEIRATPSPGGAFLAAALGLEQRDSDRGGRGVRPR